METNQEAIYGTLPWRVFQDGLLDKEAAKASTMSTESCVDIRFTSKGNSLYVICLAWPEKDVLVRALGKKGVPDKALAAVSMLGSKDAVQWRQTDDGLTLTVPREKPCRYAFVYRIDFKRE